MTCETCAFETERLEIKEWHLPARDPSRQADLARIVAAILTEPVTRSLPESWRGTYTVERAHTWIAERDQGETTLLVTEKASGYTIGLVILFEIETDCGTEVRLGYVLAETSWGKGFASELIGGFVRWCKTQNGIRSIAGGVATGNPASKRVLEKSGFLPSQIANEGGAGEEILRLILPNE